MPMPSWSWMDDAACRGEDLVLFFGREGERQPERDLRERKAKAICVQCPARVPCLEYALTRPERYGTWGNLGEDERASYRRRLQRRGELDEVAAADTVEDKRCADCGEVKPAASFYRDRTSKDGLNTYCKPCSSAYKRDSRAKRRAKQAVA